MDDDDQIARPIYPQNLDRVLGIRFTSASQLAGRVGISIEEAKRSIDFLMSIHYVEPWLAPKCENCGYVWPLCKESEEDRAPDEDCPICNHPLSEKTTLYTVYLLLREPPM
jgi:hypothetical protein